MLTEKKVAKVSEDDMSPEVAALIEPQSKCRVASKSQAVFEAQLVNTPVQFCSQC